MGTDGWAVIGKILISVTWSNTLAIILMSYWMCCSMSFKDVSVQIEIAALFGSCISLWLLVISIISFQSIETCLTQQNLDILIWLEFNLWLINNWDGYTATFVKNAHIVWHVVVLVTSRNISVWYLPWTILDSGYTRKHTLVMDDLYLHFLYIVSKTIMLISVIIIITSCICSRDNVFIMFMCVCVCLSVCSGHNFWCIEIETSFLVWWYILTISRSSLNFKVIGSRSRPPWKMLILLPGHQFNLV